MVHYECFRCGYNTKFKSSLVNHLNRKNICNPIEDDIGIEEIKKSYGFIIDKQMIPDDPKKPHFDPILTPNDPNIDQELDPKKPQKTPNDAKNDPKKPQKTPNEPICSYCNKSYSKMCHLRRHEKTCKKKKESEILVINQNEEINPNIL